MAIHLSGSLALTGSITVGTSQVNSGTLSSIVGGTSNIVSGNSSFIGAGATNNITSSQASIVGGVQNHIQNGTLHFIGGGYQNCITGSDLSTIAGGSNNCIAGRYDFIGGGRGNTISGSSHVCTSTIAGGYTNTICSDCAFIGGGESNSISNGCYAFIGGGQNNTVSLRRGAIASGRGNCINEDNGFIGAGRENTNESNSGTIVAGDDNCLTGLGRRQFIGAGQFNLIDTTGNENSIIAGFCNNITGSASVEHSHIGGGSKNLINSGSSTIAGGTLNTASAACSFIGGGARNYINTSAVSSSIVGGFDNTTNLSNTHIIGSGITADKACYTFMNNLDVEGTVSASIFSGSFVGDGSGLTGISGGGGGDYSPFLTSSNGTGIYPATGSHCTTLGNFTTIAGGILNTGSGTCGFIGSGRKNNITNLSIGSTIVAGEINLLSGSSNSAIVAGCCNILNSTSGYYGGADGSDYSIIGAGRCNELFKSCYSAIVSGRSNCLGSSAHCSFIGAGQDNTGSGNNNFIGTGCSNLIDTVTSYSSILNGRDNYLQASCSTIVGGRNNCLGCNINGGSTIAGGIANHLFGDPGFIGAGSGNRIEEYHGSNSIVGGVSNLISGSSHALGGGGGLKPAYSFIGGGRLNTGSASYTFIGGGCRNSINSFSTGSAILGGHCNTVDHDNSFVIGSCLTTTATCTTYVNNLTITGSAADNGIMTLKRFESTPSNLEAGSVFHSGSAGAGCLYFSPDGSSICQIAFLV